MYHYPLGTTFQIRFESELRVETYTVADSISDPPRGILNQGTPLGQALLKGETEYEQNGRKFRFETLSEKLPEEPNIDSSSVERLVETALAELKRYASRPVIDRIVLAGRLLLRYPSLAQQDTFWAQISNGSSVKVFFDTYPQLFISEGFVFSTTADEIVEIVRSKHRTTLSVAESCLPQDLSQCYTWPVSDIYQDLSTDDQSLIELWLKDSGENDYERAKMLSARGAEKATMQFYSSLGHQVKDIAITQLDRQSDLWKTCDILLDDNVAIDVKNARTPVHNRDSYVEHCVPQFKKIRAKEDVLIAGVLSPYLQLQYLNYPQTISFTATPITFLGEVAYTDIKSLEVAFCRDDTQLHLIDYGTVPPWMFDYSGGFYAQCEQKRLELRQIDSSHLPTPLEFSLLDLNPIPVFLCAGISLTEPWSDCLSDWQRGLYQRLLRYRSGRITLPTLFLTLLTHFLDMVKAPHSEYSPFGYADLLYTNADYQRFPLGIVDPLNTIKNLYDTLCSLWEHQGKTRLREFEFFRFRGRGLLQGRRRGSSRLETIIAYCGGDIPGKGKCGFSPLVLGEHKTCSCNRLICPECGYCSRDCTDRMIRAQSSSEDAG